MRAREITKVRSDGYTDITCAYCYQKLHKDDVVVEVVGSFYHENHSPKKVAEWRARRKATENKVPLEWAGQKKYGILARGLKLKDVV